jgi:branched-chain amino acid transport system ATP-binding protein
MTAAPAQPLAPATKTPLLSIHNLVVRYGAIEALHGISLDVQPCQIVTLIGANGAGKSSLLRALSGLVPVSKGHIHYHPDAQQHIHMEACNDENQKSTIQPDDSKIFLCRTAPHRIVSMGISHVPEGRGIFPNMTVLENLELGAYLRRDKPAIAADLDRVYALFPRIRERRTQLAGTMSGGEQQMLAIGRALMSRPKILLMDETSLGLAPLLVEQIFRVIVEINQPKEGKGVTILLVEQNAHMALQIAHYAYVLETGNIALQGPAHQIRGNDQVRKAYLGED